MAHPYAALTSLFLAAGLLGTAPFARGQAPTIAAVLPAANAVAVPRAGTLTVTFSQPLTAASAGALKVFGSQRGGMRARGTTPATVSGNSLSFAPGATPYLPGEVVHYTVTRAAAGSGGTLAQARVGQFTAAATGGSPASFQGTANLAAGSNPQLVAVGDLDGDGDLDLILANSGGTFSTLAVVLLNNGRGGFSPGTNAYLASSPLALGDFDNDGDLDLATANGTRGTCSVLVNIGNGTFTGNQELGVGGYPNGVAVGDVDGDGDLDFAASNNTVTSATICLNTGSGLFSGFRYAYTGANCTEAALGDVDNDGDLDLVACSASGGGILNVQLNAGSGPFYAGSSLVVGGAPAHVALADVNGDQALDALVANYTTGVVNVRLNNGSGTFGGSANVPVSANPLAVAAADLDGDGDLDLLAASYYDNVVSIGLNNGNGTFTPGAPVATGPGTNYVATGDLDGDGDLDFVASNDNYNYNGTVSVRLNNGTTLGSAAPRPPVALAAFPNPAHEAVALTGAVPRAAIAVLDALGRPVLTATADARGAAVLRLPAGLAPGLYMLRAGTALGRLVVE